MYQVNKLGRNYQKGKPLPIEIRTQILQNAPYCTYRTLSQSLGISPASVGNILKLHRETGGLESRPQTHVRTQSKLSFEDSVLLETIVVSQGSASLKEIEKEIIEHGHSDSLSISTISRHIRKNAVSRQRYSRKRLGKCALERFTNENMVYTQIYLDYLADKHPATITFFDESGFQLPDAGHRNYGYSPVGEPCLDVRRYLSTANHTLNLLGGIDGIKYANVITGACDGMEFLRFFQEASECVDPITQRPVIEVDDIIVVDNFAAHHGEAERALRQYFYELGVELLFLPVYSPDMNPVEEVFSKLKYLLKYKYNNIVFDNLEYAIWLALADITPGDMYGYYKHLCYI
jgi:DNA-binding transcriptional ArsR family regulator